MKHISIKSVLANLSLLIDDRYWNEAIMLEHAARGFMQINLVSKFEPKVETVTVTAHKAELPSDLKFVTQIAAKIDNKYYPVRATTNSYHNAVCTESALQPCPTCKYEYSISPSGVITLNFCDGELVISYLAIPVDEYGDILIPDDETLKEALVAYVLYKYWQVKDLMKEEGAGQRMMFYLKMWSTLSKKAMNLNLPDVAMLENIKDMRSGLVPRSSAFNYFFSKLNSPPNEPL